MSSLLLLLFFLSVVPSVAEGLEGICFKALPPRSTSSLYAHQNPLPCNNLRVPKTIFLKNSPKLTCQAPSNPQKLQTPYIHWRIIFLRVGTVPIST